MNLFSNPLSPWRLPLRFLYPANWVSEGYEEQTFYMLNHPELRQKENMLTDSSGKQVWKISLPGNSGVFAYKHCEGKTPWRYIFDLSHPAREWRNYQAIYRMNIPAGKVVAYGEERCCGILKNSYIITEFIENTRNGCDFMPGGKYRDSLAERKEFTRLLAPELAKMHKHGFFHKAIHARNVLYRNTDSGKMEIFLIDVARCRIHFKSKMKSAVLFDLYTPLRDLQLTREENLAFIDEYRKHFPECPFSAEELVLHLKSFHRHGKTFDVIGE